MPYPAAAAPESPLARLIQPVKQAIAAEVVALFNDRARGERPVPRRPDGLFGPRSVTWRVHGDVTSMMVGGIAALLLQMLHPGVPAAVSARETADLQPSLADSLGDQAWAKLEPRRYFLLYSKWCKIVSLTLWQDARHQ